MPERCAGKCAVEKGVEMRDGSSKALSRSIKGRDIIALLRLHSGVGAGASAQCALVPHLNQRM
jgi:hypothetical protein